LEDRKFVAEYISTDDPPKVGAIITLKGKRVFEVLDVSYKSIGGHLTVVLKVRPVTQ
jgi:hypothetical protein